MKITKVSVNRKFNLGNYETLDLAGEAELSEKDSPLEVWEIIRDNIEMEFQAMQRKDRNASSTLRQEVERIPSHVAPKQPEAPTELFKPATIKNTLTQMDGSVKPIAYIEDKELFAQINADLRAHGFEWLSAGKESRWVKK